ncbi:hypothetical protein TrVE_jg13897 [Triparma verrucosa]|uniref:ATP-dependent RNA helicase n=1 Tax=Triparma verrucosa TaxID=1606542 RepID=A0A9W7BWF0_9STRA|nr:hypothetical protein TrVE_jg13897 [Triparma verrucosa]
MKSSTSSVAIEFQTLRSRSKVLLLIISSLLMTTVVPFRIQSTGRRIGPLTGPLTGPRSRLCNEHCNELCSGPSGTSLCAAEPFHPLLPTWLNVNLAASNYTQPTSIQGQTVEAMVAGEEEGDATRDSALLIKSPTGSGKTLCYLLPLLSRLTQRKSLQSIIIVPTRELVVQVTWLIRRLTVNTTFMTMPITGGANSRSKGWILKDPPSVIVGTPDGITEVLRGKGWSEKVNCVVVDEVDECLRLHGEGLNKVMGRVLSGTFTGNRENDDSRFTIFTSATISDRRYFLKDVVKRGWVGSAQSCSYVSGGATGEIPGVEEVLDFGGSVMPTGLKHKYAVVNEQGKKLGLLRQWLKKTTAKKGKAGGAVIVFMRDDRDLFGIAETISKDNGGVLWSAKSDESILRSDDVDLVVSVLVESDSTRERQSALEVFKGELSRRDKRDGGGNGGGEGEGEGIDEVDDDEVYRNSKMRILVSTDNTASRGIDCPDCHTVFNFDLPDSGTSYVHRGGRAGRFGRPGEVLSIVNKKEEFVIERIGNEVGVEMKCVGREGRRGGEGERGEERNG